MKEADRALKLLFKYGISISTAESCTGGMIASEIVGYSGVSEIFKEGYVTYSNEAKNKNLGVSNDVLEEFGAVSRECASQMAVGVRKTSGSDISIVTTGIAGPEGGTKDKPVGLVYIGCAYKDSVIVRKFNFSGSRYQVRYQSMRQAFVLICDTIRKYGV